MQLGLGFRQNIQSPTYDIKGCWSFGLDLVLHDEYPIGTAEIAHEVSVLRPGNGQHLHLTAISPGGSKTTRWRFDIYRYKVV